MSMDDTTYTQQEMDDAQGQLDGCAQELANARAKIGELDRENIGLKAMLTESENRRAGLVDALTEATAEIVRLKLANAELLKAAKHFETSTHKRMPPICHCAECEDARAAIATAEAAKNVEPAEKVK